MVRGAGTDLTVNNQGMTGQFVRRPVTGDREVTARLVSRAGATADRVGLLMAKSLSPFDQAAGAIVTGGTGAQLMLRTTVAGRLHLLRDRPRPPPTAPAAAAEARRYRLHRGRVHR